MNISGSRYAPAKSAPDGEKDGNVQVAVNSIGDEDDVAEQQPASYRGIERRQKYGVIQKWTPTAFLLSYFVFSIALYTILSDYSRRAFWFLYLVIATLVAGATALEGYDGLTPLREARNAVAKTDGDGWKFKTADDALPTLNLIFDLDEQDVPDDFRTITDLADELTYPTDKVTINILRKLHDNTSATMDYVGYERPSSARILTIPAHSAASLSARVAYCLAVDAPNSASSITAVFGGGERPHPHAVRFAVERLIQDAKVDIVQGRSILVPSGGRFSLLQVLATLEYDMLNALLRPGRSITWGLNFPNQTNAYWRTNALRAAATATAIVPSDGMDLSFAAVSRNARTAHDLKVISYAPCPGTLGQFWSAQVHLARQTAVASVRYARLAFKGAFKGAFKRSKGQKSEAKAKWGFKKRFAIMYTLPIMRLVSHAIVQYFCMAWAILFTSAPTSTADFARTIYFPYPISEWLIILG